ncbi:MAG: hypothetical protein EOP50_09300 [Sphingobacteriales bacterium]|nr:MAG: hypothetical protein EOP50_09300 [Sphingobacteriales bacterium]
MLYLTVFPETKSLIPSLQNWSSRSSNSTSGFKQRNMAFAAAVYLYEATGNAVYKAYIDTHYNGTYPFVAGYWGPYYPVVHKALLRYASLPSSGPGPFATASVASAIRSNKSGQDGALSIYAYNSGTDLYRSYMPTTDYAWGSNRTKCYAALNNYDSYYFNVNPASAAAYKETAEAYLHYLHGVNALGMVMLTNMYNYGGDKCANQMSHAWFRDGSDWDDAQSSRYGPPPGYLTGGCNLDYAVSNITPPYGQPPLKAYKDWNTDWNPNTNSDEASYSITEPSISNQAAYVAALSDAIASDNNLSVLPVDFLSFDVAPGPLGAGLYWQVSETDNLLHFVVERSEDGRNFEPVATVPGVSSQLHYAYIDAAVTGSTRTVCYRIRSVETGREALSVLRWLRATAISGLKLSPNPARTQVLLEGSLDAATQFTLELRNSAGVLLRRESFSAPAGQWRGRIGLEGLAAGVHWVKVQGAGRSETFMFVKE